MSYPTTLSPWFVVQRLSPKGHMEYFRNADETTEFSTTKGLAMLFTHLPSAARTATAEVAEVRVLTDREDAKEFGRG